MGITASKPDKDLLPVTKGTLAEYMATLHKWWESLPLLWLDSMARGYTTES